MFRTSDTVLIAVMVAAAAFTYKTKHDAEQKYGEVRKLEVAIRYEEDTIDVLKADWSLLTQPARLQRLVESYAEQLKLGPVDPHQIVDLSALPDKPAIAIEDVLADAENADKEESGPDKIRKGKIGPDKIGKDKIVTGSVSQ